jgi:RES domain-containing protein
MIVYRLTKAKYANNLSGEGARLGGGRWNSKGVAMLYTSDSRALCVTEIAVHTPLGILPDNYKLITIEIPDNAISSLDVSSIPNKWNAFPYVADVKYLGDRFIKENKYLVLKVPSAVIQGDFNYLINPGHADYYKVKILKVEDFKFDQRLF